MGVKRAGRAARARWKAPLRHVNSSGVPTSSMSESQAVSRSIAVTAISSACRLTGQACGPAAQDRWDPLPDPGPCVAVVSNWLLAAA